jgi:hypothetical protein
MKTDLRQPQRETLIVQHDPATGDYFIEFPQPILESVGWKEGDTINWEPGENGSWILSKKNV